MIFNMSIIHLRSLYILFAILSLYIFFFSTIKVEAKAFEIENVEISKPFEINFDKNQVIDEGFKKAFNDLIMITVDSKNQKKINKIELNEIKAMIESFTIKEEKFVNEVYHVKLGVSFSKKNYFKYLEKKNIFPSVPSKKKFLFVPIIIDENKKNLLTLYDNKIFNEWNRNDERNHLIEYILPTEDIEDLELIKQKFKEIEEYDFKDITTKYNLKNSIIALIFKDEEDVRVLSRITIKNKVNLTNQSFFNINMNKNEEIEIIISELKVIYEDYWKNSNQINTSIKLPLTIQLKNFENNKISNFEKVLSEINLVYDFQVMKFNKDSFFYEVIFNGTPNLFLDNMKEYGYFFETQSKIWILK